jgi:regulator of replication initiation timing
LNSLRSGQTRSRKVRLGKDSPTAHANKSLDQDDVIKALKQQISDFQSRTSDLASIKKELATVSKESARLAAENKKLADSLTSAQNESKALSSKLAAARSSVQPETKNVPGSAVKARTTGVVLPGNAEAAKEATLAKQKVDLYSDLTNLVVLGVKRSEDDEDIYDCLQTGRNGSKSLSPVSSKFD